jgi:hypothetical protein
MDKQTSTRSGSTITLNGKLYNAHTGTMLDGVTRQPQAKTRQYGSFDTTPAQKIHSGPARSEALRRSGLSKPAPSRPEIKRHSRTITPLPTHPLVNHFSRPSNTHVVTPNKALSSINHTTLSAPVALATQVQNYSPSTAIQTPAKKAPQSKKEKVINHQLAQSAAQKIPKTVESRWKNLQKRLRLNPPAIVTGSIVVLVIASAICYLTIPALSLFVAAKSAGVDATYPGFVPDGYHFDGPVTYRDGDVTMQFKANGSATTFTIDQRSSYWDSGAVLDNYVLARSANYLTYSQSGITIYTFGSQAAWVNGGVLHTIDGSAPLTSDQILHIAGSM